MLFIIALYVTYFMPYLPCFLKIHTHTHAHSVLKDTVCYLALNPMKGLEV